MPIAPRCRSAEYGRLGARIPAHALYRLTDKETDDDGEPLPEKRCVLNETYWISGYEPAGEGGNEREAIDNAMWRNQG